MERISLSNGSLGKVPVLEKVLQESIKKIDVEKLFDYGDPLGNLELRKKIASLFSERIDKDNVMVTSSSQQALMITMDYLLQSRKRIFIQEPAYFGIVRLSKGKEAATFAEVKDLEKLNIQNSIIYLTSNFQGFKSMNTADKIRIAELSKERDAIVIEDNPYDFVYFQKERPNNIFELAPINTIYVNGFSKILAPGLRVGYIIADKKYTKGLKSIKINHDIFTSTMGQLTCLEALKHFEYADDLRRYFKAKRDLILRLLEYYFAHEEGFRWNTPEGGIFIMAHIPNSVPLNELIEVAREKYNLILEYDKCSYLDGKSRNTLRINFVKNSDVLLMEGIKRLQKTYEEIKNGKT